MLLNDKISPESNRDRISFVQNLWGWYQQEKINVGSTTQHTNVSGGKRSDSNYTRLIKSVKAAYWKLLYIE